jgi:hypothetical protein
MMMMMRMIFVVTGISQIIIVIVKRGCGERVKRRRTGGIGRCIGSGQNGLVPQHKNDNGVDPKTRCHQ